MKAFENLTKKTVPVIVSEGKTVEFPMLPVTALPAYKDIAKRMSSAKNTDEIFGITEDLVQLIRQVVPEEYAVERLGYTDLCALAAYLMFGVEPMDYQEQEKKDLEKKS